LNVRREPIRERLACVATIASVNTFRLANVRERELHERSPDARERRLNVSQTFPDARLADVRERSLSLIYLLTYLLTYKRYRP